MKKATLIFIGVNLIATTIFGLEIKYADLKGARHKTDSYWEVGYAGLRIWNKIRPALGEIEGIAYIKDGKWNCDILPLPELKVTGDLWLVGPGKFLQNKSGGPVIPGRGGMISGNELKAVRDGVLQLKNLTAKRGTAIIPATFFDLPRGTVSGSTCLTLTYQGKGGKQEVDVALSREYANTDGSTRIGLYNVRLSSSWWITQSCYIIQSSKTKGRIIGKIPMDTVPYEGQLETSKTPEKLQIIPGSIKVVNKSLPSFRSSDKVIWPGHLYTTASDFDAYEISLLGNVAFMVCRLQSWVPVHLWNKYPKLVNKMRKNAEYAQKGIGNFHKYGVMVILGVNDESAHLAEKVLANEYPDLRSERLTKDGKFVPVINKYGTGLCEGTPEAMKILKKELAAMLKKLFRDVDYLNCQPESRFFAPYKYLKYPYYSKGALESYRKFVKNPKAKFPTDSKIPVTARTFNTPTAKDWRNYFAWRNEIHTNFFINWAEAAKIAFGSNPRYKGGMAEDARSISIDRPDGVILEKLFASPAIELFVPEYATSLQDPYYQVWNRYAKKYKKQLVPLFDNYMIFPPKLHKSYLLIRRKKVKKLPEFSTQMEETMDDMVSNLVKIFIDAGVKTGSSGYACCSMSSYNQKTYSNLMASFCGGKAVGNPIWTVWQALIRKYYGYGAMTLAEAEKILKNIKKKKKVNPVNKSLKNISIPQAKKISLDGNKADWDFSKEAEIVDSKEQAAGFRGWKGTTDCSCKFKLAIDDKYLYFAADVTDNRVMTEKEMSGCPRCPWMDELDLYFSNEDIRNINRTWRGNNGHQIRFLPGSNKVYSGQEIAIKDSKCISKTTPNGYFIEGRIPLGYFKMKPEPGMKIALQLQLIDADDPSGVRGSLFWNPSSNGNKPEFWGMATLLSAGKKMSVKAPEDKKTAEAAEAKPLTRNTTFKLDSCSVTVDPFCKIRKLSVRGETCLNASLIAYTKGHGNLAMGGRGKQSFDKTLQPTSVYKQDGKTIITREGLLGTPKIPEILRYSYRIELSHDNTIVVSCDIEYLTDMTWAGYGATIALGGPGKATAEKGGWIAEIGPGNIRAGIFGKHQGTPECKRVNIETKFGDLGMEALAGDLRGAVKKNRNFNFSLISLPRSVHTKAGDKQNLKIKIKLQ